MQDSGFDPKANFRDNIEEAGFSQKKKPWHAPVLQHLDMNFTGHGTMSRAKKNDGVANHVRS